MTIALGGGRVLESHQPLNVHSTLRQRRGGGRNEVPGAAAPRTCGIWSRVAGVGTTGARVCIRNLRARGLELARRGSGAPYSWQPVITCLLKTKCAMSHAPPRLACLPTVRHRQRGSFVARGGWLCTDEGILSLVSGGSVRMMQTGQVVVINF